MTSGSSQQIGVGEQSYELRPFRVPKYRIQFANAAALSDIAGYVWYTPALLYLWGRFTEVNLADIVTRIQLKIFWYRFDQPIFSGLACNGDATFDHLLWAAEIEQWPKLVDAILETVQFDLSAKRIYHYAMQEVQVVDPLSQDVKRVTLAKMPQIPVNVFAVLTNEMQIAINRPKEAFLRPAVARFKPEPAHVEEARRLFAATHLNADNAFPAYRDILRNMELEAHQAKGLKLRKT